MLVGQTIPDGRFYDLESDDDLARLTDPLGALSRATGVVVLDEIQRRPELFPTLRVLADRPDSDCRFLVLGSASRELLRQSSESLAGRIAFYVLPGLTLAEVGPSHRDALWLRGGFPRSFTAEDEEVSLNWRRNFIKTFLEQDLPQLGIRTPAATIRRFWTMTAHYHGQVWNASELGRALGANDKTARNYLDMLASTFVVRVRQPWHENLGKRQVKSPKVYISDSGMLHALLGIRSQHDLLGHPKAGASWEGFLSEQIPIHLGAHEEEIYFWRAQTGPELDLFIVRGRTRLGFEFKLTTAPQVTPSMAAASTALKLSHLYVVHAGSDSFPLGKNISAVSAQQLGEQLPPLDQ
jgi:predicted AAA+ superfamily ATPase